MLKRLIIGTPLEPLARQIYRAIKPPPADATRHDRDTSLALARMRSSLKPSSNCVDIGSHRGEWLTYFAELCPEGNHIAVEPLPAFAKGIRSRYSNIELHQCALSNEEGVADFVHALDLEGWSGLREQEYPSKTKTERIAVELKTLDGIVRDRTIDFIKIDVEGAELLALSGGRKTLKRCKPLIYFEFAKVHAEPYGVTPRHIVEFFAECDMRVATLDGALLDERSLAELLDLAAASKYGPAAQTNFFAF